MTFLAAALSLTIAPCGYESRAAQDMVSVARCGTIGADGTLKLDSKWMRDLVFRDGFAEVYQSTWHLIRRDGRSAPVMTMDNGAERFSNGLVRSEVGGKIGYIDRSLRLAIARRFDGAYPFEKGIATVCLGCNLVWHGEHSTYQGGKWLCIDKSGRQIGRTRLWKKGAPLPLC